MKIIKIYECGECPYILINHPNPYGKNPVNLCSLDGGIRVAEKSLEKIHIRCPLEDYNVNNHRRNSIKQK